VEEEVEELEFEFEEEAFEEAEFVKFEEE